MPKYWSIGCGLILSGAQWCFAAELEPKYADNKELSRQLKELAEEHRGIARLETFARTAAKNDVMLLELGAGKTEERKKRPAMLVVAGIEGNDLAGTFSLVYWSRQLLERYANDDAIESLLNGHTIYVLARVNPDGAATYFQKPRVESSVSSLPKVDDDHDGMFDEDPPEDLNGDGLITSMRVEDPEGEYIIDPAEKRLMLKADRARGEKGQWRLLSEGIDNDKDEAWNEDGPGGVNFNRNFPYNYRFFASWSGLHQVSESVTRALADFVVEHPNIAIVFTFGAADNLTQPPKAEGAKKPPTTLHEDDLPFYRELGKEWRDAIGLKKELSGSSEPGTFSDWMYFHRGRLSLAARPWFPALAIELAKGKDKPADDKKEKKEEGKKDDGKKPDNRNEEERSFLKWADENAAFVDWQRFDHPDFPGKTVEIGGFAPFAKSNPPEKLLGDLAAKHAEFLTTLAKKFAEIHIRKSTARHRGEGVFEITVQVENSGYLPTALAQGETTREVHPTRVILNVDEKNILAGSRRTTLGPLAGSGGMRELRYVLYAGEQNEVEIEVISMLGGSVRATVPLER